MGNFLIKSQKYFNSILQLFSAVLEMLNIHFQSHKILENCHQSIRLTFSVSRVLFTSINSNTKDKLIVEDGKIKWILYFGLNFKAESSNN